MSVRRTAFALAAVTALITLAGCGLLKKGGADAGSDAAADAGAPAASGPTASNDADVTHFPDEQKLDPTDAKIEAWSAIVHTSTGTGTLVANLTKGTAVTKIGQRDKFFLINFDNPKDATKKLAGWVSADAFVGGTHFVAVAKDGGAHPADGGVVSAVDAGVTPSSTPAAPPGAVEYASPTGVCAADFVFAKMDGRCHKSCAASAAVCGNARCSTKCQTPAAVCITSTSACK